MGTRGAGQSEEAAVIAAHARRARCDLWDCAAHAWSQPTARAVLRYAPRQARTASYWRAKALALDGRHTCDGRAVRCAGHVAPSLAPHAPHSVAAARRGGGWPAGATSAAPPNPTSGPGIGPGRARQREDSNAETPAPHAQPGRLPFGGGARARRPAPQPPSLRNYTPARTARAGKVLGGTQGRHARGASQTATWRTDREPLVCMSSRMPIPGIFGLWGGGCFHSQRPRPRSGTEY